ncbi:MAG TPA: hypothetical protein VKB88_27395 [Bryobacteraceae bacterium]|nr:hypothetical protein [Bryobacteraceae bacterium]
MGSGVAYLDASPGWDNGMLVLNVVNRHRDQTIETEDRQFAGSIARCRVNGPDIKSENDFNNRR